VPLCKGGAVRVGIVGGTGPLGRGLAARLASAGTEVVIGSRDTERAGRVATELAGAWPAAHLSVDGASNEEAAHGELVVVATPWDAAIPTVRTLEAALRHKVVVSVASALVRQGRELHALIPGRGSIAAGVQAALPRSLVAAAGHHLPAEPLADLDTALEADVLVCADVAEAKQPVMDLFGRIPGLRPLDAGSLASAGAVEAFTAVLATLNMTYRARTALRLSGLP
jgi:NADPH-dependent F420 reductase